MILRALVILTISLLFLSSLIAFVLFQQISQIESQPNLSISFAELYLVNTTTNSNQYPPLHETIYDSVLTNISKCVPITFGIPLNEDQLYFNEKRFRCVNPRDLDGKLTLNDNKIVMECPTTSEVYVSTGVKDEIFGKYTYTNLWKSYRIPIDYPEGEFAIGKCGRSFQVLVNNRFNQTAASRAQLISSNKHKNSSNKNRTLTVIYLLLDSISRQNFYRNLQKSSAFINHHLPNLNYSVYDFSLNSVNSINTVPNLVPMLLGETAKEYSSRLKGTINNIDDWKYFEAQQNHSAIWTEFSRNGFVTLFSAETFNDFLAPYTGRKIITDHVFTNFWRVASVDLKFTEFTPSSQCIAGKPPHDYSLHYLKEFIINYQGMNRFAFVAINTGHDENCQRSKTLDEPLEEFLNEIVELHTSHDEELVFIIAADHGRYYRPMTVESEAEQLLPAHFVIASKELVQRLGLDKASTANQHRLLSRLDWYETVKFMSRFPYMEKPPDSDEILKSKTNQKNKNLFFEEVEDRGCDDIEVSADVCICHNQNLKEFTMNKYFQEVLDRTVSAINKFIDEKQIGMYCEKINEVSVISVKFYGKEHDVSPISNYFIKAYVNRSHKVLEISLFVQTISQTASRYNKNKVLKNNNEVIMRINEELKGNTLVYKIKIRGNEKWRFKSSKFPNFFESMCVNAISPVVVKARKESSCKNICQENKLICEELIDSKDILLKLSNPGLQGFLENSEDTKHNESCDEPTSNACICFDNSTL